MDSFEVFYEKVVQNIEAWKPKPPKLEKDSKEKNNTAESKTEYYYFVSDSEKQVGPISLQKLKQDVASFEIEKVAVWHTGLSEWKPLEELQSKLLS